MIEQLKKYKSKKQIALLPQDCLDIKDSVLYTLKNIIFIKQERESMEIINLINNSNIEKIYLFGNNSIYGYILPRINENIKITWVFNCTFSGLSNYNNREYLQNIFEYYDRNLIDNIGCLNKDNYEVFKNAGYNCENIILKIKNKPKNSKYENTIGILSNDYQATNNFYNQLAALTLIEYDYCKFNCTISNTREFIKLFNIKHKQEKDIPKIIEKNFVNLYINFSDTNEELIYKSFNKGVPCILGNTNFFDNNKYLKEHLIINSDDDINEIVEKINYVKENREKILNEYKKFIN